MNRQTTLIIASALTAFALVLMLGVGLTVVITSAGQPQAATPVQANASNISAQPAAPALASNVTAQPAAPTARLSADQAARIAANAAPNTRLTHTPELVNLQGTLAYEVVLNQGTLYVDANSGKVLFNNVNTNSTAATAARSRASENEREGEHND